MDVHVVFLYILTVTGWFSDQVFWLGPSIDAVPVFRIRQDAAASLILLWKVTATGFQQCSLIDGRSVTLLQAPGGLVLSEEMLALGPNHFIGESWESRRTTSWFGGWRQCVRNFTRRT